MTQQDEHELDRLCKMLEAIDHQLGSSAVLREALQKAAIALDLTFARGLRSHVETAFEGMGKPLNDVQRAHLRSLGIE